MACSPVKPDRVFMDYQRVLQSMKKVQSQGLTGEQAIMAAFEENVRDVARVGGG